MNIKQETTIEVHCDTEQLAGRLRTWAASADFTRTSTSPTGWLFHRGSNWQAVYTFDIRKVPTEVCVEISGRDPLRVYASMHCKSWLQYTSQRNRKHLSEHFGLLVEHINGAL